MVHFENPVPTFGAGFFIFEELVLPRNFYLKCISEPV